MHFKIPIQVKTREVWSEIGKQEEAYLTDFEGVEFSKEQLTFISNIFNQHGTKQANYNIMKEIKALIIEKLKYRPIGKDHARIGAMVKRYGATSIKNAIEVMSTWSFVIEDVINTLEKQAQKNIQPNQGIAVADKIDKMMEASNDEKSVSS